MYSRGVLVVISLFFLYSCGTQRLLERADKLTQKAIDKGAVIEKDTTYVLGDTIIDTVIKNDTVFVTKTVTNTEYIEGEIRYVTKKDKRRERRQQRKNDRRYYKVQKIETRLEGKAAIKEAKAHGWLFDLLLFIAGIVVGVILTVIFFVRKKN